MNNPLSSSPRASPRSDPMHRHAQIWHGVNQMDHDDISSKIKEIDSTLPTIGALASNPKVKAKDVIKAAAGFAADGKIAPSHAVQIVTNIPPDPTKLQAWLKNIYAVNLSAVVHMKAAQMQAAQPPPQMAPQMPPQAAPMASPPMAGNPLSPGTAP